VRDLFALMAFLGVKPLDDRDYWRRLLERPLKKGDERGLMRLQVARGSRGVGCLGWGGVGWGFGGARGRKAPREKGLCRGVCLRRLMRAGADRWRFERRRLLLCLRRPRCAARSRTPRAPPTPRATGPLPFSRSSWARWHCGGPRPRAARAPCPLWTCPPRPPCCSRRAGGRAPPQHRLPAAAPPGAEAALADLLRPGHAWVPRPLRPGPAVPPHLWPASPILAPPPPPPRAPHSQVDLGPDDAHEYELLEHESRALVGRSLEAGTLVPEYTNILAVIMRLRQVAGRAVGAPSLTWGL
jgi:hypothetical protein